MLGIWDIITSRKFEECPICNNKLKKIFSYKKLNVYQSNFIVSPSKYNPKEEIFSYSNAHGWEEIIAYKEHDLKISDLSTQDIKDILDLIKMRYSHLSLGENVKSIYIFHNNFSFPHFCFRVFSLPFSTRNEDGECKLCKLRNSNMVVDKNEEVYTVVNPVPRSNVEFLIVPRHVSNITELRDDEILKVAEEIKRISKFMDLKSKYYEILFFNSPIGKNYHFYISFKSVGISESLSRFGVNIINNQPEKLIGEFNGQKEP